MSITFRPPPGPDSGSGRIYAALVAAAQAGEPCPSNETLCNTCSIASPRTVSGMIHQMEKQGHITVTRTINTRRIRINALGIETGDTRPIAPARIKRPRAVSDQGLHHAGEHQPAPENLAHLGHAARAVAPVDLLSAAQHEASKRGQSIQALLAKLLWLGWQTYTQQAGQQAA